MLFISGAKQPVAKLDQLKGKTQTPETIEINLAELIDVKGMKAMGNRVTVHTVQAIELIASEPEPVIEAEEPTDEAVEPEEITDEPIADEVPEEEAKPEVTKPLESESAKPKSVESESVESKPQSVESPKKIDFEITNPDDIDIDDKGQLGLF
jgi:topoisomerase-4 subunit A